MAVVIVLMLLGIGLGFYAGSRSALKWIFPLAGKVQQAGTLILLFVMGLWLGENQEFWDNLSTIGLYGALFALCTVLGSAVAVFFLVRLFLPGEEQA